MIAGVPLSGAGGAVFAALAAIHGPAHAITPELRACLAPLVEPPGHALARALARRRAPPAIDHPTAPGPAPMARFLRRLGRRSRVFTGDRTLTCPPALRGASPDVEASARWAWASGTGDEVRDRVACLPLSLARRVARRGRP